MKIIIFLALVFYSKTVDSQKVEFISGLNINKYYDLEENLRGQIILQKLDIILEYH